MACVALLLCLGLPLTAAPYPAVSVAIDRHTTVATTADEYLGVNIDTCDIATIDFDPELIAAAARFAPAILRVGGSSVNELYLNFSESRPWSDHDMVHSNTTLPGEVWDALYAFAKATGLRLLWDLNVLGSRYASNNTWDPRNTEQLFKHIAATGKRIRAPHGDSDCTSPPCCHQGNVHRVDYVAVVR